MRLIAVLVSLFIPLSTSAHAQSGGTQRLGITSDAGSYYRFYEYTPTRAQIERDRARLRSSKAKLDAEQAALNNRWDSYEDAIVQGKRAYAELNSSIDEYNRRNDELNAKQERINESNNRLKADINQYNLARKADTSSEYIQRLGKTVARSTLNKYYDSSGNRSATKMKSQYDANQIRKQAINSQYDQIRNERVPNTQLFKMNQTRKAQLTNWSSAINNYYSDLKRDQADTSRRSDLRNKWVENFNSAQNEVERVERERQRELERQRQRYNYSNTYRGPTYQDHR